MTDELKEAFEKWAEKEGIEYAARSIAELAWQAAWQASRAALPVVDEEIAKVLKRFYGVSDIIPDVIEALRPYLHNRQPGKVFAMIAEGWLIESAIQDEKGPYYLCVQRLAGHRFHWKPDNLQAVRFCRKQDAEGVIYVVRALQPELFPLVVPMPRAVCHTWIDNTDKKDETAPVLCRMGQQSKSMDKKSQPTPDKLADSRED